jgi:superfamily II DNA/RNA helicase
LLAVGKKTTGMVWIVTPTMELALQLQGVVHNLACSGGGDHPNSSSILHVVGHEEAKETSILKESTAQEEDGESFPLLSSINQSPMMFAGTPLMLQRLKREIDLASSSYKLRIDDDKNLRKTARAISSNLQTVVLDEADRLLQTEAVARNLQSRRQEKTSGSKKKPSRTRRLSETTTEHLLGTLLLDAMPRRKQLQIICASATVGRTLRRQLMEMLQAPSMDKAAVLITADVRTKKDAAARKSSLLPSTLEHAYLLQPDTTSGDPQQDILDTLWKTLQDKLEPAPTLIFPGRVGNDRVQEELRRKGLQGVRGLSANMQTAENGESNHHHDSRWQTTPVYVVGEKLGRGLDLNGIRYVILLQVPSSAAGYTHLAGRTGRNGEKGTAIAFCQPREAPKLLAIAETLGLSFFDMSSSSSAPSEETMARQPEQPLKVGNENNEENQTLPWATLSESSLTRKTIAEISEYLANHGISLLDENGKKAKKADLLSAVHELHRSAE